ncbi:MAG: carboxypeptidase-like regulatory domain-containing protein [Armatimonadota bacterium]|nr:carboxypeptidase-like regulatory domain-containing protein [Armatimonadota bacterium]
MKRTWLCLALALLGAAAVALAEEVTITGRVVGPDGEGIAGAVVGVRHPDVDVPPPRWLEARTGRDGRFSITFETESPRELCQVAVAAENYASDGLPAAPGEPCEVRLTDAVGAITGRVVDAEGEPVAGAEVRATTLYDPEDETRPRAYFGDWDRGPRDVSDENGAFELTGIAARGDVLVMAVGPDGETGCSIVCDPDQPFQPTFYLEPLGMLEGRLLDEDGEPAAGVTIHLFPERAVGLWGAIQRPPPVTLSDRATADEEGRFRFQKLLPGLEYSLYASEAVRGLVVRHRFIAAPGEQSVELSLADER